MKFSISHPVTGSSLLSDRLYVLIYTVTSRYIHLLVFDLAKGGIDASHKREVNHRLPTGSSHGAYTRYSSDSRPIQAGQSSVFVNIPVQSNAVEAMLRRSGSAQCVHVV